MILGIDIGGTYLRYELRKAEKSIEKKRLKSKNIALSTFIEKKLLDEKNIKFVSISFAGQVHQGKIISAPHIHIDKKDIKAYIESKYRVKLFIENDLSCAILAEAKFYKNNNITALYVGTGLGMGILSSGELLRGSSNIAAEIGHIPYKETPFICHCGKSNCLELIASGSGILRLKANKKLDSHLTLEELRRSKDEKARELYANFIEALLHAVGITITLCNSEILVLGGGIITTDMEIYKTIQTEIKNYAMPLSLQNIKIVRSQLEDAALEGAFLLKDTYVK